MSGKAGPGENPAQERRVSAVWEGISTALSWMTIFPFAGARSFDRGTGSRAMAALPVAGILIGACGGLVFALFSHSPLIAAALGLAVAELCTRFMHVDAVADVADALGSYAPPDKARDILRDSRSGAFAVAAVALVYIVLFAAFASAPSPWFVFFSLWAGRMVGQVPASTSFVPYSTSGFGGLIIGTVRWWWIAAWWAVISGSSLLVCGPWIAVASAVALAGAYFFSKHLSTRFEGLNGDCVGSCVLLGTTLTAVLASFLGAL